MKISFTVFSNSAKLFFMSLALVALGSKSASAIDVTATSAFGLWSDVSSWDIRVPLAGDNVIIPSGTQIGIIQAGAVGATLSISGSLSVGTGGLDISGEIIINAGGQININPTRTVKCFGFTVSASATSIVLNGNLDIGGGVWTNSGAVSPIAGNVYDFSELINTSSIALSGTINGPSADGTIINSHTSFITNSGAGASISASGTSNIYVRGTGASNGFVCGNNTFTYTGTNTITTYGTSTINGGTGTTFNNIVAGTAVLTSSLTLTATSGTSQVRGTLTIPVGSAATITGTPVWDFTNSGLPLANAGSFSVASSADARFLDLTNAGTSFSNAGSITVNRDFSDNGTLNSTSTSTFSFGSASAMRLTTVQGTKFFNLLQNGNGSLTVLTTGTFEVAGSFSNSSASGTADFTGGAATDSVTFTGSAQTIFGGIGGTTFNNMTIPGTYAMSNSASNVVNLVGRLRLTGSGTFDSDGSGGLAKFTLKSIGTGNLLTSQTGSIARLPTPGNLSGNMTIERFYPGFGTRRWQYLSFPFSSSVFVSDLQASGFKVNGHFSSGSSGLVNESMFTFLPGAGYEVWNGIGWGSASTATYPLLNNVGYAALAYSDNTSPTISLKGAPAKGSLTNHVSVVASGATGYNLIPNPYPAPLDFIKFYNANSSLIGTVAEVETNNDEASAGSSNTATYTRTSSTTGTCFNCGSSGWTGTIASGQSFWITAAAPGSLSYTESMKSEGLTKYIGRTEQENSKDYVRITLISGNMKDEAGVFFRDGAKETFNKLNDAKKRLSGNPVEGSVNRTYVNVGTLKSDTPDPLIVNFFPLIDCQTGAKKIKLWVQVTQAGSHSLKFTDLETFGLGYSITLNDKYLNKQVAVSNGTEYSFSTSDLASTYGSERFELVFAKELAVPTITVKDSEFTTLDAPVIQWYRDGKAIEGATKKTFVATESGSYTVVSGYSNGCTKSSLPLVLVITSLSKEDNNYLVYPNPGEGVYTLTLPNMVANREINLTDSKGVEVNANVKIDPDSGLVSFDLSNYSAGLYIVKIKESSSYRYIKVIKK